MKIYTIYIARNKVNSKVYIGFDSNWPHRYKVHVKDYLKDNTKGRKFYAALRKYGLDNFEWEILYQSKDRNHTLGTMENYFITQYDSYRHGYNMTLGGQGTFGFAVESTEESRKKQSEANKAYYAKHGAPVKSEETKQKISVSKKGTIPWNKDKSGYFTEDAINRMSESNKIQLSCPHCKFACNRSNAKRWHFDNCEKHPNFDPIKRAEKLMIGRVSRLSDKKELDAGNWSQYVKRMNKMNGVV